MHRTSPNILQQLQVLSSFGGQGLGQIQRRQESDAHVDFPAGAGDLGDCLIHLGDMLAQVCGIYAPQKEFLSADCHFQGI